MANIAQMVNVLQAMILTEGEKMVLTPTYHIFKMMKGHMDGEKLDVDYMSEMIDVNGTSVPKVSVSASEKNGEVTVSMCNISLESDEELEIDLRDGDFVSAKAQLLTSKNMTDCNTFESPETVKPAEMEVSLKDGKLTLTLPKMSAAVITLN